MNVLKKYIFYTKLVLVFVFLVIVAGGVVRTTQSGMGCPDWPACFGYLIPPTQYEQVLFQPNHVYNKGQFIIHSDSLKYAKQKFLSGNTYNEANWQQYEKHNYAKFEVYQTWTEYINRLITGLLGFLVLFHVVWSFLLFYKTKRSIFWLSFSLIVFIGFEAWLGKLVVDTNLAVLQISGHMLFALALAAIPVVILSKIDNKEKVHDNSLKWLSILVLLLLFTQIILGTEVRGQIDIISQSLGYEKREVWISLLSSVFAWHRSFAFAVSICCVIFFWRSMHYTQLQRTAYFILFCVLCEMVLGLTMAYFNIPAFVQPLHLLFSSMLVIAVFNYRLKLR